MICFITDRRPGERNILPDIARRPLTVTRLDGTPIATIQPPPDGWTHELLGRQALDLRDATCDGADAWLGTTWVGSTEV